MSVVGSSVRRAGRGRSTEAAKIVDPTFEAMID